MDTSLTRTLNGWGARHDWLGDLAGAVAQDVVFLVVAVAAACFLAAGRWTSPGGRRGAVSAAAALALALLAGQVVSSLVDRARPFVDHPAIHALIAHARDAGFPSDHATGAFAIAVALLLRHRLAGTVALGLASLVAVARVVVGVHYPTDVLGGAGLGALAALTLYAPGPRRALDAVAGLAAQVYDRALRLGRHAPATESRERPAA